MINQKLIYKILSLYGFKQSDIQILPSQAGYRNKVVPLEYNSKEKLALIFYKAEPGILEKIKTANQVSNYLARKNWPTRRTRTRILPQIQSLSQTSPFPQQSIVQITSSTKTYYCCLYNYLPGFTINWESYSMKHIKLLGQVLGWLHHDLKDFPSKSLSNEVTNLEAKLAIMNKYFIQKNVINALEQKLKLNINKNTFVQFEQLLFQVSKLTEQQALHLDFVRGNILFNNSSDNSISDKLIFVDQRKKDDLTSNLYISGVLDLEKTAVGPKLIDLARTLAFLIIDCKYKENEKVKKYFLNSGYQKRGQQTLTNQRLLEPLIAYFLFYDLYKFLKHNPYESLSKNEHFVRTSQWLVKKRLLSSVII